MMVESRSTVAIFCSAHRRPTSCTISWLTCAKARSGGALLSDITHLACRQFLLRLFALRLVVELVQKLAGGLGARHFVPQHLAQSLVLAQAIKIVETFPAQRIQHEETLYIPSLIQAPLTLLELQCCFTRPGTSSDRAACRNSGMPPYAVTH